MRALLLLVAAIATLYATASYVTHFDADFEVAAIIAIVALGGVFAVDERGRL